MKKIDKDLATSIDFSLTQKSVYNDHRKTFVESFVGNHYSDVMQGAHKPKIYENNLEVYVNSLLAILSPLKVKVHVEVESPELKPMGYTISLAMEKILAESEYKNSVCKAIEDSLFSIGVIKTGLSYIGEYEGHDIGAPFVDYVSADNYFFDFTAESFDTIQFEGNDYWLETELVKEIYGVKVDGTSDRIDESHGGKTESLSGRSIASTSYKERVMLRDVYITSERKLITYIVDTQEIIKEADYDGPEASPYFKLFYYDVPGCIFPLSPVAIIYGLHTANVDIYRKNVMQALSQKTITLLPASTQMDVERINKTPDGLSASVTGKSKPEKMSTSGVQQQTMVFGKEVRGDFSRQAGNLDSLAGLKSQADTFRQESMLADSASVRVNYMQTKVNDFMTKIVKTLAWYAWTDPIREIKVNKPIGNTGLFVPVTWDSETTEGDFLDYNFNITVSSSVTESPEMKYSKFMKIFNEVIIPLVPEIHNSGGVLKVQDIISKCSDLTDTDIEDIVDFSGMNMQGNQQMEDVSAPKKEHVYQHVGAGGGDKDVSLQNMLSAEDNKD